MFGLHRLKLTGPSVHGQNLSRPLKACLAAVLLLAAGCVYLPRSENTVVSYAEPPKPGSRIGTLLSQAPEASDRAMLVEDPDFALTARIDLIDAADTSIDAQYFIWQNDATGILVIEKLLAAADRGVRVRVLVDDLMLEGLVSRLNTLADHPNVDIRIFNPFSVRLRSPLRLFRVAEFAIDGNRLNHRMHNKLLVADNQLAILGGRNIGDEYFGRSAKRNFLDTDILLSGSIVPELSQGFDTYWNSRWAYPVAAVANIAFLSGDVARTRERIRKRLAEHPELDALARNVAYEDTIARLLAGPDLKWAIVVADDPDVSWFQRPDEMAAELTEVALTAEREVCIVSPYLIPTRNLFGIGQTLSERGVKITILTNSLASNDIVTAHAAYARFRKDILKTGAALYEMRGEPELARNDHAEHVSLHSKYILFDDDIVFIGSLNLDPRSLYLNTELGVVLESPALAQSLRASFHSMIRPENAWRVTITPHGLQWESSEGIVTRQPAKRAWQRFRSWWLSLMPVASQL